MWNNDRLVKTITEHFGDSQLVVVSNREPYLHYYAPDGSMKVKRSVGGVSISFDSILKATQGLWVAYGGSEADRAATNARGEVKLPPGRERYTLRRVWMSPAELKGYYHGFSNSTLWPLCHVAFVKPVFRPSDWRMYQRINRRFADETIAALTEQSGVVWIQDYQFALLAKYLRRQRPDLLIGQFWHIPWPTFEVFRICPWKAELLIGLLGNDLIGFHRSFHARNFLDAVARELEANVDFDAQTVRYKGRTTRIVVQPVGIDAADIHDRLQRLQHRTSAVLDRIGPRPARLAVGVDRIDYTKGIPRRLAALEQFFAKYPSYRGRLSYVGVASPSRTTIPAYRTLGLQIERAVTRINAAFATKRWQPIHYLPEFIDRSEILLLLRDADLCLVTSLDDGMNLVAKEFVAANAGEGALVLSEFTGSANDLREALLVNPYDDAALVEAIRDGLELSPPDRAKRLTAMRERVQENNLFRWAGKFLTKLADTRAVE